MILRSLIIKDFGPFRGRQVFDFPKSPGLYFMWGENQEQPRLGGNGAGKSKCWEALLWVIYGKTSRGLKAGDAANWEVTKGAEVILEYQHDSEELPRFLTRTWAPNSWTLKDLFGNVHDLAKDEANPFLEALRLDFNQFLHVILSAQFEPMFLDLKPDPKENLFSQVMDLDRWTEYSQKATKAAGDLDARGRVLERELATIDGQILEVESNTAGLKAAADWEEENAAQIKDLEARLDRGPVAIKLGDELVAEIEAELRGLEDRQTEMKAASRDLRDELAEAEADQDECQRIVTSLATEQRLIQQKIDSHELDGKDVCPLCSQPIDEKTLEQHRAELGKELGRIKRKLTVAEHDLDAAKTNAKRLASQAERTADGLQDLRAEITKNTKDLEHAIDLRDAARLQQKKLAQQLADLRSAENPHAAANKRAQDRLDDLQAKKARITRQLDDVLGQWRITLAWAKWFKEIRLEQIAEALIQLEIEVNSALSDLGLNGWDLLFEVDRELKGGSVKRGFHVHVKSPSSQRAVPWESWSGGEGQRLRLSGQQGLGNLIRARRGCPLELEVWDEPTQGLNELGVNDLLDCLRTRAITEKRQIWIVDHRSFGYGGFSGSVKVIKDKHGHSSFTYPDPYI